MTENTALWDKLGKTDPKHTKKFKRAGGFEGTAIKPMWSYRRMTEEFGPCGIGWGVNRPEFQVVPAPEGEVLVFCTASIWYRHGATPTPEAKDAGMQIVYGDQHTVYGVGGDKAVGKNKYGLAVDDEAFKKAYTDAVTNALKLIGVGADIHMGMFDDNKYVNTMTAEFNGEPAPPKPVSASKNELSRDGYTILETALRLATTRVELKLWADANRLAIGRLPADWQGTLRTEYTRHMESLPEGYQEEQAA